MGVNLKDIISSKPISFEELKGKVIAIDALNSIYQFLSSIRQPDGTPLMDSQGRTTSHLSGILYRTTRLVELGIKPIYVFDGEPPELKRKELRERRKLKEDAEREWKKALEEKRLEDAKKFASRTSRFTDEMRDDSKSLLDGMGIPWIHAPSEGEAQCVHLCQKGDSWAIGSQDYDSLLLGSERLVRGLTLSGSFELEIIQLEQVLRDLEITREQLIDLAILVGTDFNPGVKGIGPKKALKAIKEGSLEGMHLEFNPEPIREIFLKPRVTDNYRLEWNLPKEESLVELLCEKHDFSEDRIEKAVEKLTEAMRGFSQQELSRWF